MATIRKRADGVWWAVSSKRDQVGRANALKADPIGKIGVARLGVEEVDKWIARRRKQGKGDGTIRYQLQVRLQPDERRRREPPLLAGGSRPARRSVGTSLDMDWLMDDFEAVDRVLLTSIG